METAPQKPEAASADQHREEEQPCVVLGVIVAPGFARDVTAKIAAELGDDLRALDTGVDWRTELTVDRLVAPPVQTTEIIDAARRKLLDANWDLGVVVTDLPLRVGRRPVSRQVSPTHGIAVVSLPALGALHLVPRLRRTLLELVGELVGDRDGQWSGDGALARLRRRWGRGVLQELATDTADRPGALRFLLIAEVLSSHLRLLLGMVRANRPWRLAARLYRALLAAVVAGAYGLVTSDIWRISATAGSTRLALASIASISFTSGAVIVAHGLWERAPDRHLRDQVILFNFATAATVLIGIATLYAALLLMIFAAAELLLSPHALNSGLGHPVATGDYATLAWFTASLATVSGALGAGLESDEAVREAAYASSTESDERKES
ncbi:MAG TPA: hypothetical protein VH063_09070 [Gaiellaceae bacterium]|nr:hypothetical protein [Gaiellaceae bacterium]